MGLAFVLLGLPFLTTKAVLKKTEVNTRASSAPNSYKFVWVGANTSDQFSDEHINYIAKNYDILVFSRMHGNGDKEKHHEATRRIKQINPNITILAYIPTSIRHDTDTFGESSFKDEWYLRRSNGDRIAQSEGYYVDLSNSDYRNWVLDIISDWFAVAPYDGVAFDNGNKIEGGARKDELVDAIGETRLSEFNDGFTLLYKKAKKRFAEKIVLFNGIADHDFIRNRSLDTLDLLGYALNEKFCYTRSGRQDKSVNLEDIKIMQDYAAKGKTVLQKTNHPLEWDDDPSLYKKRDDAARFCFGVFLLGYEPGRSYYKYGHAYGVSYGKDNYKDEIKENALEINLDLGKPIKPYESDGEIYKRKFQRAWVLVNLDDKEKRVKLWRDEWRQSVVLLNGGVETTKVYPDGFITIKPHDAMFLKFTAKSKAGEEGQ